MKTAKMALMVALLWAKCDGDDYIGTSGIKYQRKHRKKRKRRTRVIGYKSQPITVKLFHRTDNK